MYPYNRNTHYFQQQSLTAREAKDPAIAELAEDDRLLALLKVAAEETAQLANRYRRLLTEALSSPPLPICSNPCIWTRKSI